MARRRVAITGLGVVNPFGGDLDDFFSRLLRAESASSFLHIDDEHCPIAIPAVRCRGFDPVAVLGQPLAHTSDRFSQLALAAVISAWRDAGLPEKTHAEHNDYGVSWGTGVGGTLTFERGYRDMFIEERKRVLPLSLLLAMNNAAASQIAIRFGLGGPCLSYTVACASSAVSIGEAFKRIRDGEAALMVVGGSEAPLACGVIRAWEALRVLAPGDAETSGRACRPFDQERGGLVLGEGAGALVLEDWDHAVARGARIYAELSGYATNCDHAHLVRPDSNGQIRAMRDVLDDAGLKPDEIDYVNAHGTATREGDPAEIAALKTVFGARAARLPVSATKSMLGHMLGATSAVEAVITVLSLFRGEIPPTAHLEQLDPVCEGVHHVTGGPLTGVRIRAALSNSFAFGGSNAVLAFKAVS